MTADDCAFLRLHIEAGWGARVPPLGERPTSLLPGGAVPPWTIYVAAVGSLTVEIRRAGIDAHAAAPYVARLRQALMWPPSRHTSDGITAEVLFRLAGEAPDLSDVPAGARRITRHELALMESFDRGAASYYLLAPDRAPVFAAVADGRVLAVAHSSRRTATACELGIETLPEARRRGYARALTRLWSAAVLGEGHVPIYSALATNVASLALAESAGFRVCARGAYLMG